MVKDPELKKVERIEEKILKEEAEIKQTEAHIREDEKKIAQSEKVILGTLNKHPLKAIVPGIFTTDEMRYLREIFTRRYRFLISAFATLGGIMIWYGIWHTLELIPLLSVGVVSFLVGLLILWLVKRYSDF